MLSTRLSSRIMASLCAVSLLGAVACAPQNSVTPGVSNPSTSEQTPVTETVETELILTEEVNGVENPITPEQMDSIEVDGQVIAQDDIEIVTGDFSTQQARAEASAKAKYEARTIAGIKQSILKISRLKKNAKIKSLLIKFRSRSGENHDIQIARLEELLKKQKDKAFRIKVKQNGTVVGGSAKNDGSLDEQETKFKANKEKIEIFEKGEKKTFSLTGEGSAESTEQATEEEQAELEANALSPIALFVGKWRAELLGKSVLAELSDEGNGRIGGTATVDGQSYSASADYTMSAGQTSELEVVAQNPLGGTLTFQANVEQQNTLTLKLIDADNNPQVTPFLNIPVSLKRDL